MKAEGNTLLYTKQEFAQYAQEHGSHGLVAKMLGSDSTELATNFQTTSIALSIGGHSLVGTVNEKEYYNSPICSPLNLFCLYPRQRLKSMDRKWLKILLQTVTSLFLTSFKVLQFNRVVQINNKPCDAIVHPELNSSQLEHCLEKLTTELPNHAVVFPRVDPTCNPILFESLQKKGFMMVPTRPIHLYPPHGNHMKRGHTKRDFALMRKEKHTFVPHDEITETDIIRIHELYQMLFIDKHSRENPNLTLRYFQDSHACSWYRFFAMRNADGIIDAFLSYEIQNNTMACGPLGYDTSRPQEEGLYRVIFAKSLEIALQNQCLFNFGGGNEVFKMNRGSKREISYTAVYCRHLPLYRRFPWWILSDLSRKITLKIFEKNIF